MTLKEATLKSLGEIVVLATFSEVHDHIVKNAYYDFKDAKTPSHTVSAILGNFIRDQDTRVKRIKKAGGTYSYYLTKNEQEIGEEALLKAAEDKKKASKTKTFQERDLHKLLSSYLKNTQVYAKTIFHEQSNGTDSNQIWTHPDMVAIKFLNLQTRASRDFLRSINQVDTFKISSFEIKKEITTDTELKKAFFQAVSNSSWANYGYLVAFEFGDNLLDEMERLNQSFGIGILELKSNPYQSKVLFTPKYRELDFKTIDKLCKINGEFEQFIQLTDNLLKADERFYNGSEKELDTFCDDYFNEDAEIKSFCIKHHIPFEDTKEEKDG